jgi:hypothetical protein
MLNRQFISPPTFNCPASLSARRGTEGEAAAIPNVKLHFLPLACVRADAATLLISLEVLGFFNNLAALEATPFDVCSFFALAIIVILSV